MTPFRTAFVLGAGLGTRLRPLTLVRPKPLIPVCNRPLIAYAFDHLLAHGVERFVVNMHWRSEVYAHEFPEAVYHGAPIAFRDEQPEVLETAGGIKNVEDLLGGEPFIVYNGDILSDLPLEPALRAHRERGNEVTMVLRSKDGPLQVACDEASGHVTDIGRRVDPASEPRFLFTGIYLVNPEFLARIPPATKLSVIPIFLEMIRSGAPLGGVVIDDGHWWDLGSREQYLAVHQHFAAAGKVEERSMLDVSPPPSTIHHPSPSDPSPWIAPTARVARTAELLGATAVGPDAIIGEGARLRDCIVWNGAQVAPGADLTACIVTDGARVAGLHAQSDL